MRGLVRRIASHRPGGWENACNKRGLDPNLSYLAEWQTWSSTDAYSEETVHVLTPEGGLLYRGLTKYFERVVKSDKTLRDFL